MNTKQIGNITEMQCMLSFLELGYNVLTPYGDCERYDFVADINGKFYKIQSKTSISDDNGASFKIHCKSSNRKNGKIVSHRYFSDEIDFFSTYYNGKCYLIPVEECGAGKKLRLLPSQNNQEKGISWATNYEIEKIISGL